MPKDSTDPSGTLAHHLRRLIEASGPISIAQYMAEALGNPDYGYYTTQNPIGAAGDFITSPEVSQMFGELIGLWCADAWQKAGSPSPVRWVEIGPGRGTLMRDAIRASHALPSFRESIDVHLVETSPVLRSHQREALKDVNVTWHDRFQDVPSGPVLVVANELFDALPIHQFQRTVDAWQERLIDIDRNRNGFRYVLGPVSAAFSLVPEELRQAPIGSVAEASPASVSLMRDIAERIVGNGGAALIIDYGSIENRPRDTLQAVIGHGTHAVLDAPGSADLSAHVDFETLGQVARELGTTVWGPVLQGDFLEALGIRARAAQLKQSATPAQIQDIDSALDRLTGPGQMGTLFKVMAVTPPGVSTPGGFEETP